ncbi:MAG: sigma-70 family RNA polymerase sigma factor [Bacteroidia bacterium]|nr:sigma-70 family RNA polymerase sigma factor [Bacteroidia bacterium]
MDANAHTEVEEPISVVEGLAKGNSNAMKMVYQNHFGMVRHLVVKNSGSDADAEDVFQEAMVILFQKLSSDDFELKVKLKTYLYSVCRNLWLNELKRRGRRRSTLKDYEKHVETGFLFTADWKERREEHLNLMEKGMKYLGEKCQQILLLYYYNKRPMADIAVELGYSNADSAKNQKYKCLRQLKWNMKH